MTADVKKLSYTSRGVSDLPKVMHSGALMGDTRILMVTCNPALLGVVEKALAEGLPTAQLDHVSKVAAAVESLKAIKYAVALIDVTCPCSEGLDGVRRVSGCDVAVLVVMDESDCKAGVAALRAGAHDYVIKSEIEPRLLRRCIEYAIERTQGEKAIRQRDAQLLQKQRIEALGEMAGGVAHEFNNLLQIIQTYGSFAAEGLHPAEQRRKDLQEVLAAANRAAMLTAQLLGFSRRRTVQRSAIDPDEVIERLIQMLRPLIGEHIQVELALESGVATLNVDSVLFEQMLTNVCLNARDAMPHGGMITIATEMIVMTTDDLQMRPDLEPGRYIVITIADNGCGMSADIREKIFNPFFTTKEVGKGTGLGLFMVYGVVKQHGGTVNVYSEPGLGTTMRLYLPAIVDEAAAPEVDLDLRVPGGTETILIAEDEPGVQRVTERILVRAGYSTLCASDGAEAIRVFEKNVDRISAVILDAVMPKLMGRHVYEAIRCIKEDVPVLFCTGFDKETGLFDYVAREGLPILTKPFQSSALLQAIRKIIDEPVTERSSPAEVCVGHL